MKFFLYKKTKDSSKLVLINKHIKLIFLLDFLKLHKKFTYNLSEYLYYNSKYKTLLKNNLIVSSKVVSSFIQGGNFFKNSILLNNIFTKFYKLMHNSNNSSLKFNDYRYYKEFLYNFSRYNNYNNLNYLLNWVFYLIEPMFHIECSIVPKKYRKKLKKKYLYKIKYLNKNKRINKILSWISKYSNTLKTYSILNRKLLVYLDLFLNYKHSYIYSKKISIYKKVFKI